MSFIIFKEPIEEQSLNATGCFNQVQSGISSSGLITHEDVITNDDLIKETPFLMYNINKNPDPQDRIYDNSYSTLTEIKANFSGCYFAKECQTAMNDTNIIFDDSEYGGGEGQIWNLCHTDSLQKIYDKKNGEIQNLLLVIFISSLALLALGICGTCYEFWLKYGDSVDCLYYKSNCKNAGPQIIKSNGDTTSSEISLIDYMYPNNISYYPYQRCLMTSDKFPSQSGGSKNEAAGFRSNYKQYALNNTRCIKVFQDKDKENKRPFPYNIADYANENINSEIIKMPFKSFSFHFLFPVLLSRIILNALLKSLSNTYQKTIEKNTFMKTLVFILSNGLLFVLLGELGVGGLNSAIGPFTIVIGLTMIINFVMNLTPSTLLMLFPKTLFFIINGGEKAMTKACKDILIKDSKNILNNDGIGDPYAYYRIFGPNNFYPISKGPNEPGRSLSTRIFNFVKNFYMIIAIFFMFIVSMVTGIFSFILAILYLSSSVVFNTFYIPLSNPLEFFDLLKSHSQFLTLLYCAFVVGGMKTMGFNNSTVAISSGVLGIIIIYKLLSTKFV